jgi:glutamate dehydrogenase (NAD(P)+)
VAAEFAGLSLPKARLAIEGFGNVGRHAARFLVEQGAVLVAASDRGGTIVDPKGIDVDRLSDAKRRSGSITAYGDGERRAPSDLFRVDCDILIPAARPDVIHADNAREIRAKLVLQGANIPATPEAEALLHQRGVVVVPDFIANAGGVICAGVEYRGGSEAEAFEAIAEKIRRNTRDVLRRSRDERIAPRQAAVELATARVSEAQSYRRATRG